jgi:hypothetical protein
LEHPVLVAESGGEIADRLIPVSASGVDKQGEARRPPVRGVEHFNDQVQVLAQTRPDNAISPNSASPRWFEA